MQIRSDSRSYYERIGGEAGIRQLVESFYRHMDELPGVGPVRAMHAADLSGAVDKLFMFLSGWMGGPPLYVEKYGHPRLRMRHMPFAIDDAARDQWMQCMRAALDETVQDPGLRDDLLYSFQEVADFMRNQP